MRALSILLASLILTLIATEVSATEQRREPARSYSCKIVTGWGTAIGRGSSPLAAKEAARELCGSKLIDQYAAQRGRISDDAAADLIDTCINLECQ